MIYLVDSEAIKKLRDYAEKRENWRDLREKERPTKVPGDSALFTCSIPTSKKKRSLRLVYSVDVDPQLGPCKHASFSMSNNTAPAGGIIMTVGKELGFNFNDLIHAGPTPGDKPWVMHLIAKHAT